MKNLKALSILIFTTIFIGTAYAADSEQKIPAGTLVDMLLKNQKSYVEIPKGTLIPAQSLDFAINKGCFASLAWFAEYTDRHTSQSRSPLLRRPFVAYNDFMVSRDHIYLYSPLEDDFAGFLTCALPIDPN